MSDRKQKILDNAIRIIATEGYAKLTLRSLARASDIKLGALQYHFRTWNDLVQALADYAEERYREAFFQLKGDPDAQSLETLVSFLFDDVPGQSLHGDRLWPQLWAMSQVEPEVKRLVDGIYQKCLRLFEDALKREGSLSPRGDALALLSLIEGSALFVETGGLWRRDAKALRRSALTIAANMVDTQHSEARLKAANA